jgi:peptidoglycan biosynthesis protein MviN/MurJ (putative lipid II flippase)
VVISIILGKIFALHYGVMGLAIGFSIGAAVSTIIVYLLLRQRAGFKNEKQVLIFTLKVLLASIIMAVAVQESKILAGLFVDMQRFWGVLAKTSIALSVGTGVYLLCCWIFGIEEISAIKIILNKMAHKGIDESPVE